MLDIYEMQIFLAAAETGSFSEAGRRLRMSQPAVSMQIRSLEKRLDVELFHRAGRHIRLSELGETLIPMARKLVNMSIHIEETISSLNGEVIGSLQLACSTTAGKYVLPKLIAGFIDLYPLTQVTCNVVSRGSALDMLLEGNAHVAITSLREISKELEYRPFTTDSVVLIVPPDHPWAELKTIQPEQLTTVKYIRRELRSGTTQTVTEGLAKLDISLHDLPIAMELGSSEAIRVAVSEGIGAAFVSYQAAEEGIAAGSVVEVKVKGLKIEQQLYMVRHAGYMMLTAQAAFWDYVYSDEGMEIIKGMAIVDTEPA
jgi:LysR family transcriptional regulator, low CO2-responsive transcriptional regulator